MKEMLKGYSRKETVFKSEIPYMRSQAGFRATFPQKQYLDSKYIVKLWTLQPRCSVQPCYTEWAALHFISVAQPLPLITNKAQLKAGLKKGTRTVDTASSHKGGKYMRHTCYALHLHKCLHPDSLGHHAVEKCHPSINTAQAGPQEEQELQIPSTKAVYFSTHTPFPWNTIYPLACPSVIWNMTHAISSPPFLFAHTIFTSATLYQDTGKQVSSQTATLLLQSHLTISVHHYFCLFLERATILSAHLAGKQHLILQHNLAPALQIIAAGEMAPAWRKTQSCNTQFTTLNTDAMQLRHLDKLGITSIGLHMLSTAALKPSSW